jgi:FAD/FMN-containing dehydrogenase
MTSTTSTGSGLRQRLDGQTLLPGEAGYDPARQVWNAAVDRHPAAIVRPASVADVQAAVRYAAENGLPVSVRGGGHHHAGHAVGDGAVTLDLSGWRQVCVDPAAGTVTVQPGASWGGLDQATQQFGLGTTGADVPVVGVAGTVLGGGFGWLHRRLGLACDNLLAAELVTADANVTTVDAGSSPGLLWALRGGGGAVGVVTSLTLAVHPVGPIVTGAAMLPLDQARDGLAAYRQLTAEAPDELFARAMLLTAPPAPFVPEPLRGRPVLLLASAWIGDPGAAEAALSWLRALGGPPPEQISYLALQRLTEQGFPSRVRAAARGHVLDGISDGLLDALCDAAGDAPPLWMISLQPGGGAMGRIPAGATAFPHRHATHYLHAQGMTAPDEQGEQHAAWVAGLDHRIRPHTTGAVYANVAMPADGVDVAAAAYGPNLPRLAALKAQLDPANRFRFTPLTAGAPVDQVGSAVLFANDRVRVWEMLLHPGETCAPHRHRNDFLLLYPDAAVMRPHAGPGLEHVTPGLVGYVTVGAGGIGPHQITNAGAEPVTHYVIELLGPSATATAQPIAHNGRTRPEPEPAESADAEHGAGPPAPDAPAGWRVLGFGRNPEVAATIQRRLRSLGQQATNFALTDDPAGDARLVRELRQADYDAVAIGGFINGQDPEAPPTEQTTLWFNRVLNLIHTHAPQAKIVLVRSPADAVPALHRVLAPHSGPAPER